jgi:hypothetical protein
MKMASSNVRNHGKGFYYEEQPGIGPILKKKRMKEVVSAATNPWDIIDDMLNVGGDGRMETAKSGHTQAQGVKGRATVFYGKDLFKGLHMDPAGMTSTGLSKGFRSSRTGKNGSAHKHRAMSN